MPISKIIQSLSGEKTDDSNIATQTRNNINILKNCSVLCGCGGMAIPMSVQGNRYQCVRCDKQHINMQYNLGYRNAENDWMILRKDPSQIIDMDYYNEAVALLKKAKK